MEPITYVPARPEDREVLFALNKALIDKYENVEAIDYAAVLAWTERKLEKRVEEYTRICLGGTVAGYYHLIPGAEKTELDDFYILPPYRGRGIGTRALKDCIQRAAGPLFLYVFSRNAGAIRLYERMGFQITKTAGETRCIMERN